MRSLTYLVACSVDRFIARDDRSFDYALPDGEHYAMLAERFPEMFPTHLRDMYGIRTGNKSFDAVLMGRRTYEVGLDLGITSPYSHLEQFVFSKSIRESPDAKVTLVSGDVLTAVRTIKAQPGLGVWLCGGAALATTVFSEIDELILKVNPVMLGSGIPLFSGRVAETKVRIVDNTSYDNGFMLVRYRMSR